MNTLYSWNGRAGALAVALLAQLAPAQVEAEVVTLEELEQLALQNQARWEAVEAASTQAAAEVDAARAGLRPTFWLNAWSVIAPGSEIQRVRNTAGEEVNVRASPTVEEPGAFRPNARYEGTIQLRAPLYDGKNRAEIKAAEAYRAAARASSGASRQTVLNMVRASYLDWLAAFLVHESATTSSKDARAQRERVSARVADGDRPPSEADAARYEELQAELVAVDALARTISAKRLLESAVGTELPPGAEPDRALLVIDAKHPEPEAGWEIEALELQSDAAREEARMHRKSRVPVLAAIGQTGLAGINDRVFPMYRLGIELSVPLWDGGRATSLAHAADARAIELDALARDAKIERDDEQRRALLDRRHADEQLALADGIVSISKKRVEQAQTSYDLGAGSLEAVAEARAALRDAEARRVEILVARADAVVRLRQQ